MVRSEIGCCIMLKMKLRKVNRDIRKCLNPTRMIWDNPKEIGQVDYEKFMKEPIRFYKLGKLARRIREWTWECTI